VEYLANLADKVYYFPQYKEVGIDKDNVEIMKDSVKAFTGEERLEAAELRSGETLPVDGVFCLRDSVALATLLPDIATEKGHIVVDRSMATNLKGVYAAGDCTGRPYQYTKAVGEGNVAAHSVIEYLGAFVN
jgi:thioredoxin reductase (NADPH)